MKSLFALTILISIVVFIGNAYAPEPWKYEPSKYKVNVSVSCDDETTKNLILSTMNRELRTLGDVELVNQDDAEFILSLIAIPHTHKHSGNKTGQISLAVMKLYKRTAQGAIIMALGEYHKTFEKGLGDDIFASRFPKITEIAKTHGSLPTFDLPELTLIVNIDNNNLSNTCKEIVATFDVKNLEPGRKLRREFKKTIDRINQNLDNPKSR